MLTVRFIEHITTNVDLYCRRSLDNDIVITLILRRKFGNTPKDRLSLT